jgi:hypothetical protein
MSKMYIVFRAKFLEGDKSVKKNVISGLFRPAIKKSEIIEFSESNG